MIGETEAIGNNRWLLLTALLGLAAYTSVRASRKLLCAVLILLVGIAGWLNGYKFRTQEQFADSVSGRTGSVTGKIYDIRESTSGLRLYLTASEIDGTNADGEETTFTGRTKCVVYAEAVESVQLGQTVRCTGTWDCPEPASNPGGFRADVYYGSKGIFLTLRSADVLICDATCSAFLVGLNRIKNKASDIFEQVFAPAEASTLAAMLLGDKSDLDGEVKKLYQINGIAHILAISGVKTENLAIPQGGAKPVNTAFVAIHYAKKYILKLCFSGEITPRCRFPDSRG